jgi:hypothetical protein
LIVKKPTCNCLKTATEKKHKCSGITVLSVSDYIESGFDFTKTNSNGIHGYTIFTENHYCPQCGKPYEEESV